MDLTYVRDGGCDAYVRGVYLAVTVNLQKNCGEVGRGVPRLPAPHHAPTTDII